jgi:hypothetical protein
MERFLSTQEQHIANIAITKYGKSDKDDIFFDNDKAILVAWNNGQTMWIHFSN